jgi:hypothetical protein
LVLLLLVAVVVVEVGLALVPAVGLDLVPEVALVPEVGLDLVPEVGLDLVPEVGLGSLSCSGPMQHSSRWFRSPRHISQGTFSAAIHVRCLRTAMWLQERCE